MWSLLNNRSVGCTVFKNVSLKKKCCCFEYLKKISLKKREVGEDNLGLSSSEDFYST